MTTIKITEKAFVRVSNHENGFYVQLVFNGGESAGKINIYKTAKQALKKAESIKENY